MFHTVTVFNTNGEIMKEKGKNYIKTVRKALIWKATIFKDFFNTWRFKRCAAESSSLNEVSLPKLLNIGFGEYLPLSPCILDTLSLYNCSVFSANSASRFCLKDFSALRSLSLERIHNMKEFFKKKTVAKWHLLLLFPANRDFLWWKTNYRKVQDKECISFLLFFSHYAKLTCNICGSLSLLAEISNSEV